MSCFGMKLSLPRAQDQSLCVGAPLALAAQITGELGGEACRIQAKLF